jgi:hypothetical protein
VDVFAFSTQEKLLIRLGVLRGRNGRS